jgi:predicted PurR-regulated permease PerM
MLSRLPLPGRGATNPTATSILSNALQELIAFLRNAAVPYLKRGFDLIIELVSVVVMAIYLARHPSIYVDGTVALVPPPHRPLARDILGDLRITLRAWVVGQIIAMVVLAALTTLLLWLIGLPYFLAFGTFAGIAAIVPIFGTLFSTVIPVLFALGSSGLGLALAVAAVGVGVHLVEANFISPYVMERQVNVPPVLTILGVLLMGKLFGPVGLIVAVPTLATIMVLVRHVLLGEIYGDPLARHVAAGTVTPEQPRTITAEASLKP